MNPRVSRSSALASKATGFPIAKIAAKMAIGYTLDEVPNDITHRGDTPRGPPGQRFARRALVSRSLRADARLRRRQGPPLRLREVPGRRPDADDDDEVGRRGDGDRAQLHRGAAEGPALAREEGRRLPLGRRGHDRRGRAAPRGGQGPDRRPDRPRAAGPPWRVHRRGGARGDRHRPVVPRPDRSSSTRSPAMLAERRPADAGPASARQAARLQRRAGRLAARACRRPSSAGCGTRSACAPSTRPSTPARPSSRRTTPYHYSSYDEETEVAPRERPAVIILGSGPNRIGQGVEFDYSCVHASFALRDAGYDTVMVNCNPETVSTDYDTSSRLYFEPLTLEDVLEVIHAESQAGPIAGVIVQLGGPDAARARAGPRRRGRADRRHLAGRDPPRRGPRRLRPGARPAPGSSPRSTARRSAPTRRSPSPARSATRCSSGRPTSSAAGAWSSSTTTTRSSPTSRRPPRPRPTTRSSSTASSTTRSRSTSTRSSTAQDLYLGGIMEHVEEAGSPLRRQRVHAAARRPSATPSSSGSGWRPASSPRASASGA